MKKRILAFLLSLSLLMSLFIGTGTLSVSALTDQPAPTGLVGIPPKTPNGSNGIIKGTTTAMEYKLSTNTTYTNALSSLTTGLPPGTYNVRFKAKTGYNAGAVADVVILNPAAYNNFYYTDDGTSVTITGDDNSDRSVSIPSSINGKPVVEIGYKAFYSKPITSVIIPDSVNTIGEQAFKDCNNLTDVSLGNGLISIESLAFSYCEDLTSINIPDSTTSIGVSSFSSCYNLVDVSFGNGLRSIGNSAFSACRSITSIDIPAYVTIGGYAFNYCVSLADITFPDSNLSIGDNAFANCSSLTDITIPNFYTTLGISVFEYCTSLTNASIASNISRWTFEGCSALTNVTIGNSVTLIDRSAFINCTSLFNVTLGNSLISIEDSAFKGCSSLTSIVIPEGVTTIEDLAFNGCTLLNSITIPNSVTNIGSYSYTPFGNTPNLTIYCHSGSAILQYAINNHLNYFISDLLPQSAPIGLAGVSATRTDVADGKITGTTTDMEYIVLYGDTYLPATNIETTGLYGGTYFVRYAAKDGFSASPKTVVVVPHGENLDQQAPIGLTSFAPTTLGGSNGKIMGTTTDMEYKLSTNSNYIGVTGSQITGLYAGTYNVRFKAKLGYNAGAVADVVILDPPVYGDYAYTDNGTSITITGYMGPDLDVIIPGTILGKPVTCIGNGAFASNSLYSIEIPDSVTVIGDEAFIESWNLTSIDIPDSVTSIGSRAFLSSQSLVTVTLGSNLSSIGELAFANCPSLTSIAIPDSVTIIGSSAFELCAKLATVTMGNGLSSIGSFAFMGCTSLTDISIPNGTTTIGELVFNNCTSLVNATIGGSNIGLNMFEGCSALTNVTVGNSVTLIDKFAFLNCTSLSSVNLGNSLITINDGAFMGCSSLTSIIIPDGVTTIRDMAFADCTMLSSIYIPDSVTLTYVGQHTAFDNTPNLTIYCHSGSSTVQYAINRGLNYSILDLLPQPAPTGLAAVSPTSENGADGKIIGTDLTMEYKSALSETYLPIEGNEITGLSPGIYYIRYKSNLYYQPSDAATLKILRPYSNGYQILRGTLNNGIVTVDSGQTSVAIRPNTLAGQTFTYTVNGVSRNLFYNGTEQKYFAVVNKSELQFDTDIVFTIVQTGQSYNLIVKGKSSLMEQPAPTGLAGVAESAAFANDGKITGTITAMEYKLSSSQTYITATNIETTGLSAGTYNVRYAAKPGYYASDYIIVEVPAYTVQCQRVPTGLAGVIVTSAGANDGKITGTTTSMEYKLDSDSTYTPASNTETTGLAPGTYNVRYAAKPGYEASDVTNVVVPDLPTFTISGYTGLPGCLITIDTLSAISNSSGFFAIEGVYAGAYNMVVSKPGAIVRTIPIAVIDQNINILEIKMILGDVNNDGLINVSDVGLAKTNYGSVLGDAGYNVNCDISPDNRINISDIGIVKTNYGKTALLYQNEEYAIIFN